MRTVAIVRQYLAAAFLIVIGLIVSGCGDTATVNPEVELASLSVTTETATATLEPDFIPATTNYTVNLTSGTERVTIAASPAVPGDTVTIDGQQTNSKSVDLNPPGGPSKVVQIVVSESTNKSRTYTVTLNSTAVDNSLKALSVSVGTDPPLTLTPSFDPNVTKYSVGVDDAITRVTVSATKSDQNTVMQIGSVTVGAGTAAGEAIIPLSGTGAVTPVSIDVTAPNGTKRSYTVDLSRGPSPNTNLGTLRTSEGRLEPPFRDNRFEYRVNVASDVKSMTVTATPQDKSAKRVTINGQETSSRSINLEPQGSRTQIFVTVTAQNDALKTTTVNVFRAALGGNDNLSALDVSPGTLTPAFDEDRQGYTVDVDNNVERISITPTVEDRAATMTVNGDPATSGQAQTITLRGPGLSTVINIVVIAPNDSSQTYTITVDRADPSRNNNLSELTVTANDALQALNPNFASNILEYRVEVASNIASVIVSATKSDKNAAMSGSVTAGAGTRRGAATLDLGGEGSDTNVSMTVAAPDPNVAPKIYRMTIKRTDATRPPAPGAPDLIPEDDFAPPGTNEDNITNVTTPRFKISQPGAGETAKLYIDGTEVTANFDPGANTLKPTAALSGSDEGVKHLITSTVTNAAGLESPQSPSLEVTIDTGASGEDDDD